jgi:hypothetical protein
VDELSLDWHETVPGEEFTAELDGELLFVSKRNGGWHSKWLSYYGDSPNVVLRYTDRLAIRERCIWRTAPRNKETGMNDMKHRIKDSMRDWMSSIARVYDGIVLPILIGAAAGAVLAGVVYWGLLV